MAKPYKEITKTEFSKNYNVVKVLTDKFEIMKQLETFNSNDQAIAFGVRKKSRDATPIWFKQYQEKMDKTLENIMFEIRGIKNRLDIIEDKLVRNNIN